MKRNIFQKSVCVLLVVMMLTSVMSISSSAVVNSKNIKNSVGSPESISVLNVYIDEPVAKSTMETTPMCMGVGYSIGNNYKWYKDGKAVENSVFEAGKSYKIECTVYADTTEGYKFADNAELRVNGVSVNRNKLDSMNNMTTAFSFTYDFGILPDVIENVGVVVTAPKNGDNPSYNAAVVDNSKYHIAKKEYNPVVWYENGVEMSAESTFVAGNEYSLVVKVSAGYGFVFTSANTGEYSVTVNGNTASATKNMEDDLLEIEYNFGVCKETPDGYNPGEKLKVSNVEVLGIDIPVPGETPDYTATTANPSVYTLAKYGLNQGGMLWYTSEGDVLASEYRFVAGKTYRLEVKLESAKIGTAIVCDFVSPVTATISGYTVKADEIYVNQTNVMLYYDFYCEEHKCRLVKVDGIAPTCTNVGQREYYYCSECGSYFEDNSGKTEIFDIDKWSLILPVGNHKLEFVYGKNPGCTVDGIVDHYKCSECGKTFEDEQGNKEITDTVLPATDHDWDSMCVSLGTSGHAYYCNNPGCSEHTLVEEHMYGEFNKCFECGYAKPKPLTSTENKVYQNLDVTKDGAREIVSYAKKNKISTDVILVTAKSITKQKSEEVKAAEYKKLSAKASGASKTKITIKWLKIKDADGYIVYGSKCSGKFKELKSLGKTKTSYTHSGLKKGTYYKYVVVAYKFIADANVSISVSKTVHCATTGGKVGNAKAVKVNKTKVALKKGKTFTVKAKNVKKDKTIKKHRNIGFESTNTKVATVNSNGKIKAKKKGTCYVYAYAQNGVAKKIKVTVK